MSMNQPFTGNKRFEILSVLGKGGMSVVYSAYDRELEKPVALKSFQGGASELYRLKTEFRTLQELDHPNLVSLGELFEEDGHWFFTMELVQGTDIISHIWHKEKPLPPKQGSDEPEQTCKNREPAMDEDRLRAAFVQLVDALDTIHAKQRVHRDIKPANILVEPDGRLVLLDFGLVTQPDPGLHSAEHHHPVGTAAYMAPEQAVVGEIGPAADWYSMGVLLYESLTGSLPFLGTYNQILLSKHYHTPTNPMENHPGIPQDLADLTMALMRQEPMSRPDAQTIQSVLKGTLQTLDRQNPKTTTKTQIFIGRDNELGVILNTCEDLRETGFRSLLIHGTSGLGKSELLKAAGRAILGKNPETIFLWSRCNERESVSFKAFDGVVDALSRNLLRLSERELGRLTPRNADLLARVFPVLACLNESGGIPFRRARQVHESQEVRGLAFWALREHLTLLAELYPVVIVIDDVQWADEDSLQLLRVLMQDPDPPPVLLLMSMRTPPDAQEASAEVEILLKQIPFFPEVLTLGPLEPEAARKLASFLMKDLEHTTTEQEPDTDCIAREAGGHPLFIHELVHHLGTRKTQPGAGNLKLDDVLWARICQLEKPLSDLVELVAISIGPLRQDVAGRILHVPATAVFMMATRLRLLHLVRTSGSGAEDTLEPYHDRVREAVQARLDETSRMNWHRALVKNLRSSKHVEPVRLAEHLAATGEKLDAAQLFTVAGDHATDNLAFDRASGLYEKAIRLLRETSSEPDLKAIRKLTIRMGSVLASAGRGWEASCAFLDAVPGAKTADALDLKRRAAEQLLYAGFIDQGMEIIAEILDVIGVGIPRSPLGRLLSVLWQRFRFRLRGLSFRERDETQVSREILVHADILRSLSMGLGGADLLLSAYFSIRFVIRAMRIGDPRRVLLGLCIEANLEAANKPGSAYGKLVMEHCENIQAKLNDPRTLSYLDTARAFECFMQGQWSRSRKFTENALTAMDELSGMHWERSMMNNQYIWSLFYLGELDAMGRHIQLVLQDARSRGDLFSTSGMVLGLGNIGILNQDGPNRARQIIDDLMERWSVKGYHLQHYWALLAMVNIHLYTTEPALGIERIRSEWGNLRKNLLLLIPAIRNEVRHTRSRAALSLAVHEKGSKKKELLTLAHRDAKKLARTRLPWTRAMSTLLDAGILAQHGNEDHSVAQLQKAIELLDACEMHLYAAAARIRIGYVLGGDEGNDLRTDGVSFMQSQCVRDTSAMLRVLAPGWEKE